jgi:DNA-binding GntR family transcriptional regulator
MKEAELDTNADKFDGGAGKPGEAGATEGVLTATDKVAEAITRGIRAGVFVPGQHLLEPDLMARIGISRGSLREALKHLAAAGLVELSRFRGAYVASLDRKAVLDLLETLEPLARLAARLAAGNAAAGAAKQRMRRIAEAIEAASRAGARTAYLEQRWRFYDTLIAIGGNQELGRVMPLARTDLFRAQLESVQTLQQRARHAAGYAKIADAIIAGDVRAADLAVKRHFEGTRKTMDELPNGAFPTDGAAAG